MDERMLLCDYKDELKNAHGYDEEFAQNIAILADSMVESYGEDYRDVIFSAIKSCKFKSAKTKKSGVMETVEEVISSEGIVVNNGDRRDLKTSLVAYGEQPNIVSEDGNFKIASVTRTMALSPRFNWENPESLYFLAKETDTLVNGYLNGYSIDGTTLTTKTGLRTQIEFIEDSRGDVTRTLISDRGYGLENGLSLYEACRMVRENYDPSYDPTGFDYERLSSGFIESLGLKDHIRIARVTKDKSELERALPNGLDPLIEAFDELSELEAVRMNSVLDSQQLSEASVSLEEFFQKRMSPLVTEISSSLSKEGIQNVIK
ncbi:MAG TPA: hypothetical protein DCY94_03440 [Firmicutes bacterium]|nr:hypothetical protein [Bacillota bacterium]